MWFGSLREQTTRFLFPNERDDWLAVLRIGLGLQVILFCWSIRTDWNYLLESGGGLISRTMSEKLLSLESTFVPRLGWFVDIGSKLGLGEDSILTTLWFVLITAGFLLVAGLASRSAAITAWFLHLAVVKSGDLISYGVDNFTTIGLFYLMLSPLPDRFALDARLWEKTTKSPQLLGFWRRVLQTHMCLIYFFGGIAKATGIGWCDGSNVWRALIRPPFNMIDPHTLVHWKFVFPIAGVSILALETAYPLFIWPKKTRMLWLSLICAMHVGIGLAMGMYLFALVMIVLNVAAFGPDIRLSFPQTSRHRPSSDERRRCRIDLDRRAGFCDHAAAEKGGL
jgi:hypothetical protein